MADKLANGLFISELLPDNAGNGATDTDGDGTANHSDEFVEIQNNSNGTVSLDGIQIWTEQNGLLFSFGASDTIGPGGTATLVGQYDGAEPAGFYDAGLNEGDRLLQDGEGNKWDNVFLYDSNTNTYVVISYGQPPRPVNLPTGFPAGATQVGAGETITSNGPNGDAFARDAAGNLIETTPTPGVPDVFCFARGTHIDTPFGPTPVEALKPGDLVVTKSGYKPLRAVGYTKLSADALRCLPQLKPVVFAKGALGNDRRIVTSPNHRVALSSETVQRYCGHAEAFLPAKSMVGTDGIEIRDKDQGITYYHLLFEAHEVLSLGGAWMESLFLSDLSHTAIETMKAAGQWAGKTIEVSHDQTALPCLKVIEAQLVMRGVQSELV